MPLDNSTILIDFSSHQGGKYWFWATLEEGEGSL